MDHLISMIVNRPYVVALVLTFAVVAVAERGWFRMLIWLFVGSFIGWLSEFVSTRTGFPFSWYEYYPSSFPNDIWISNIPLFASLSFAALSYFGLSLTTTLFSTLRIGKHGVEREENEPLYLSLKTALWASLLITWTDFVVDPVAHLGEYWFLGKIYFWITKTAAWHFDVPLYNYFGWLVTVFAIIFANQRIDEFLSKRGYPPKPAFSLPNRCLWSLGYYLGNYMFILCVSIYLYFNSAVPEEKHVGLVLTNTLIFVVSFIAFMGFLLLVKLRESMPFLKNHAI